MNTEDILMTLKPIFYIYPDNNLEPVVVFNTNMIYPCLLVMAIKVFEFIYYYN